MVIISCKDGNAVAHVVDRPDIGVGKIDYNKLIYNPLTDTGYRQHQDTYYSGSVARNVEHTPDEIIQSNSTMLNIFLHTKRLEGCSYQTLCNYRITLKNFMFTLVKPFTEITTLDCRNYLVEYKDTRGISNNTLDDMRRVLNTFFRFLEEEDFILKSPMRKVHRIKGEFIVKRPFSEEDIVRIRDSCINMRELAMIDFLNSSGVRVGEFIDLDIRDINLEHREGIVYGKGAKERIIYFDPQSKIHIEKYLSIRKDSNPALFVGPKHPHARLTKSGVEYMCKEIGERAGVTNCHPHRFRRSLATRLIKKGVPLEQVQRILGHSKIETTLIYAEVSQADVKMNHDKYAS